MRKTAFILIVLFSISISGSTTRATIVDIEECTDWGGRTLPSDLWTFDHDSQVLTLTFFAYYVPYVPHDRRPLELQPIWVAGGQDSKSTLTVIENITNETGLSLSGYYLNLSNTRSEYSEIVVGTVRATGSPDVRREHTHHIELAWSEPIPDGESFTIQFDVLNYRNIQESFCFGLDQSVVPEPATMTLVGLGGLALVRTRRFIRTHRKA